ncbi:cytochrome ubiquinol oxidase subunit I [Nocardiopsis sp. RSe5-2]|uniref:Cytochrome ubiquinol oxidase subunit I n=1 Tax=Nocardiopsis endophytica TaxID=3018445 RepID=A0ABT4U7S0_9ACTN|nr:cytochrome ubiquinol oxidase subunit I [Nocardiopsis endophytica]MDA2813008.1 cytochrome ubiquinol oxidase subunit I [Nocardiopsis endophytica]
MPLVDKLELARLQFGATLTIHFLFVALTLGLVLVVAVAQTRWYRTGDPHQERMVRFWGLIYTVNYALGVVTGIINEFQMGLNWGGLAKFTGNVFGTALALETMMAFFLEATFLGMWIFGWGRLPRRIHLALIWAVAATAYISAFWIIMANGFLQRPGGFEVRGDQAYLTDFSALVTNINPWNALTHVTSAALTLAGFAMAAIGAYHLLKGGRHTEFFRRSVRTGLGLGGAGAILLLITGSLQFNDVIDAQPVKRAVLIGDTERLAEYEAEMAGRFGEGSYAPDSLLPLKLLSDTMLYIGVVLVVLAVIGFVLLRRNAFVRRRWFLRVLLVSPLLPVVAMASGWLFREIGRQPWAVYEVLPTADAVSPGATAGGLLATLVLFGVLYIVLAAADYLVIARIARRGPDLDGWAFIQGDVHGEADGGGRSAPAAEGRRP